MKQVNVYPNPAKDYVVIENDIENENLGEFVVIANTLGKEIRKIELHENCKSERIDISGLPKGFYLLFFENGCIQPKMISKIK